jgi:hypothetical protein
VRPRNCNRCAVPLARRAWLQPNKLVKLASVALGNGRSNASPVPLILLDLLQPPDGIVAVELDGGGRRVFATEGKRPDAEPSPSLDLMGAQPMMPVIQVEDYLIRVRRSQR